jgi:hypothetical protein
MSKYSRSGGKYTGNHTTLIPLASSICDMVHAIPEVKKITPGFIRSGLRSANGNRRVKITQSSDNCLLFSIRDNSSHQEVRVYVINIQRVKAILEQKLEEHNISVTFVKNK